MAGEVSNGGSERTTGTPQRHFVHTALPCCSALNIATLCVSLALHLIRATGRATATLWRTSGTPLVAPLHGNSWS